MHDQGEEKNQKGNNISIRAVTAFNSADPVDCYFSHYVYRIYFIDEHECISLE